MATAASALPSSHIEFTHDYALQPWVVVFAASLFFFFEFMQVNMFNALEPHLIRAFHIGATKLGHLSAGYFYANVAALIPAGLILDRMSTRKAIISAMAATTTFTFIFALSTAFWQAELARFVTGFSGAFCLLGAVRLASRWFPPRRMALVVGLIVTFAMLGATMAQTPLTILSDALGWRKTLMIDAGLGVALLGVIYLFVKDYPPGTGAHYKEEKQILHELGFWGSLVGALSNIQNWLAGIYTSLINLPIFLLGATWGSMYLVQVRHLTREQASFVTSMLFIGLIIGSPAMGWISDRLRQRRMPMLIGGVLALLNVLIIMYVPHLSFMALFLLFFSFGFILATQIVSYPLIAESNPLLITGAAESVASVLIMSGGFTIPLFAVLMNVGWSHTVINELPIYSLGNFDHAFMIMPIGFVIALGAAWLVKETNCESYEDRQRALSQQNG